MRQLLLNLASCVALLAHTASGVAAPAAAPAKQVAPAKAPAKAPAPVPAPPPIPASKLTTQGGMMGAPPPPGENDPDPPTFRTVIHTQAYKKRDHLGQHVNIKVTPPEKRGAKGRVLVEVYNYSKTYLSVADFYLILTSDLGERVEVHIDVNDIKPNWSALRWVKVPGGKIPKITRVEIQGLQTYGQNAKKVKIPYYTDLIKE